MTEFDTFLGARADADTDVVSAALDTAQASLEDAAKATFDRNQPQAEALHKKLLATAEPLTLALRNEFDQAQDHYNYYALAQQIGTWQDSHRNDLEQLQKIFVSEVVDEDLAKNLSKLNTLTLSLQTIVDAIYGTSVTQLEDHSFKPDLDQLGEALTRAKKAVTSGMATKFRKTEQEATALNERVLTSAGNLLTKLENNLPQAKYKAMARAVTEWDTEYANAISRAKLLVEQDQSGLVPLVKLATLMQVIAGILTPDPKS